LRRLWRFAGGPVGKTLLGLTLLVAVAGGVAFNHFWWKYSKIIDAKLVGGPFNHTSKILAAPEAVYVGEELTLDEVLKRLREAGYSTSAHNGTGHYKVKEDALEIYPGSLSYFAQEPAVIYFGDGKITRVVSLNDNTPQTAYELEPELVTNLFDQDRSKRRLFRYEDYPERMVQAIIAIEDHRFFSHNGIDLIRTTKAALDGLREWRQPRGTSTLSQQLARNFFLTPDQNYSRKLAELMIAFQLELRLDKERIFEYYANQVSIGRVGSFNVMGMGEGARAFFNKDVRDVTLAEAALLAGLPQGPSFLNPYRHPERAKNRRRQVLAAMRREGFISDDDYQEANAAELNLARGTIESSDAPYYVDLVNAHLRKSFESEELITQEYWVYTTLDKNLQEIAVNAVNKGMEEVDKIVARQRRFKDKTPPKAQAALVALDPKTGEVKAIVGGRNYGESQLNRVLAKRQPGSVFKPFVYAAALDTALDAERVDALLDYTPGPVYTPNSLVDDVPTTFWYDEKPYEPANHRNRIYGLISFRYALMRSINIATVKVAEMAGFDRVAEMAKRAGFGEDIQPTPSIALGSYEATPLQVAGAYTALVNGGVMKKPYFVRLVRDPKGRTLHRNWPEEEEVMDPRVAYLVTNMLEDVLNRGTGIRARALYDFREPAAGKTGTDDDGWFAGFTNNLLCVVWVGFDDNTDLSVEGAHSALPIWTEFMLGAHKHRAYRNPEPFEAPEGVVAVAVDAETGELATYACPDRIEEVFVAGSQPTRFCSIHGSGGRMLASSVAGWGRPAAAKESDEVSVEDDKRPAPEPQPIVQKINDPGPAPAPKPKTKPAKKSGLFGRIADIFR